MNKNLNQTNKELDIFRKKIDQIDLKILKLLEERMNIVKEVGQFKNKINDRFFIKPVREFEMIKNLLTKSSDNIFNTTIISIWRKIITNANLLEQKVSIALHNPDKNNNYNYCLREYFNDLVPIHNFENASNIIHLIEQEKYQIAAFILPKNLDDSKDSQWWIYLASMAKNNIKIYDKISFKIDGNECQLVLAAKKENEKSKNDNIITVIEFDRNITINQIINKFKSLNIGINILAKSNLSQVKNINFYLIELQGFFEMNHVKIKELMESDIKPFIKIIGCYPV